MMALSVSYKWIEVDRYTYEIHIRDFGDLEFERGRSFITSTMGYPWRLRIHPRGNGQSNENVEHVSIMVKYQGGSTETNAVVADIIVRTNTSNHSFSKHEFSKGKEALYSIPNFAKRTDILEKDCNGEGTLILTVSIRTVVLASRKVATTATTTAEDTRTVAPAARKVAPATTITAEDVRKVTSAAQKVTATTLATPTTPAVEDLFARIRKPTVLTGLARGESTSSVVTPTNSPTSNESETETTASALLMALPQTVRIFILSFLGETQEELRELPLVSKQFYKDCKEPGIGWEFLSSFVLSAKDNDEDNGRTMNFIHTMNQYQQDEDTRRKLARYNIFKVENLDKFDQVPDDELFHNNNGVEILRWMELKGIRSLNMSSLPSTTMVPMNNSLTRALSRIMSNLHELNFSHTTFNIGNVLIGFSLHCRHLEKITWTNINKNVDLHGFGLGFARNLKEINMDDSNFKIMLEQEEEEMSDLNNHPTIFIFHECGSTVLERVSIRNAKYHKIDNTSGSVSQNMLIKFIRQAPATLTWFRSDLTQENIEMLTKEQPRIQLLN